MILFTSDVEFKGFGMRQLCCTKTITKTKTFESTATRDGYVNQMLLSDSL